MSWFGRALTLGECPRWDDERGVLSWVDIDGGTLYEGHEDASGWTEAWHQVGTPLAGAMRWADREDWLVAVGGEVAMWTVADGLRPLVMVEPAHQHCPVRLNEMVTDPIGRLWVGSMAYDWTPGAGAFFRIDHDGSVHRVLGGITVANGMGWSPDGSVVYTTDTGPAQITAWDYDLGTGEVSRPRRFVRAGQGDGKPDGLAVDTEGNVWSAFAGGYRVSCFDPTGRDIHRVVVPSPNPTSCCFVGPERDRLVVTTGRKRLAAGVLAVYPDSGRIWDAGRLGARGLPQLPYCGAPPGSSPQVSGTRAQRRSEREAGPDRR